MARRPSREFSLPLQGAWLMDRKGGADNQGILRSGEVKSGLRVNGRSLKLRFRWRRSLSLGAGRGSALGGRLFRPARSSASGAHYQMTKNRPWAPFPTPILPRTASHLTVSLPQGAVDPLLGVTGRSFSPLPQQTVPFHKAGLHLLGSRLSGKPGDLRPLHLSTPGPSTASPRLKPGRI